MSDQPARSEASKRAAPGSEAALTELRGDIARLEAELYEIETRTAQVERDGLDQPTAPDRPRSVRMADDLASASVERERADMARFLEGTLTVCATRVAEAQSEARAMLGAAREELARAGQERALLVEEVIASPPRPEDAPQTEPVETGVLATAEAVATVEGSVSVEPDAPAAAVAADHVAPSVEVASSVPASPRAASGRRRESVISLLMWIVGGALVVVGVAFAIVVLLMLLD